MPKQSGYAPQAALLKALAHPTRLRILDILSRGEACVCHLTAILKKRQPYVSQQLMVLREAGCVQDRRDGVIVYYGLTDSRITELIARSRELVIARGQGIGCPPVPVAPVEGCPCPKCAAAAGRLA